jgi:hypothetical protein
MTTAHANERRRAQHLIELAAAIEESPAFRLLEGAGDDTWRGRRPLLCRNVLASNHRQAVQAADELRWQAWLLEQQATRLEVQALLESGRAG